MKTTVNVSLLLLAVGLGFEVGSYRAVSAAAGPAVISAQELRIVDGRGALRAAIAVNPQSGAAALSVFEPNNTNPRVIVGVRSDGLGTVEFRDSAGAKRAELVSTGAGAVRLAFWDQDAQRAASPRLAASVDPQNGVASISMFGANNSKPRVLVGVRSDGIGSLEFRDGDGNKRAELTAAAAGDVRLNLLDKDLKGGVLLGSSGGQTALVLNDSESRHRSILALNATGDASATIYDKDGKIVWQAPEHKN